MCYFRSVISFEKNITHTQFPGVGCWIYFFLSFCLLSLLLLSRSSSFINLWRILSSTELNLNFISLIFSSCFVFGVHQGTQTLGTTQAPGDHLGSRTPRNSRKRNSLSSFVCVWKNKNPFGDSSFFWVFAFGDSESLHDRKINHLFLGFPVPSNLYVWVLRVVMRSKKNKLPASQFPGLE